ncbi:MAG: hypothetical protein NHB14_15330 [Desulfosporosinus sp.]|nr:hypothetical protein [Desulfosporosinus sp.]
MVTNNESNNVSVIDLSSYQVIKTIGTGNGPHGFRISKDSKFAYVANLGSDTISILDLIEFKEVTKIKVGKTPVTTAVTSDGKTMFASVNAENSLAMVYLVTKKIDKIPVGKDQLRFICNQTINTYLLLTRVLNRNPQILLAKLI